MPHAKLGVEKVQRSRVKNRERNILILVLAILCACGLVALVSPAPVEGRKRTAMTAQAKTIRFIPDLLKVPAR